MMSQKSVQAAREKKARRLHFTVTAKDAEELDWFLASSVGLGC